MATPENNITTVIPGTEGGGALTLAHPKGGGAITWAPIQGGGAITWAPTEGGGAITWAPTQGGGAITWAPMEGGGAITWAPMEGGGAWGQEWVDAAVFSMKVTLTVLCTVFNLTGVLVIICNRLHEKSIMYFLLLLTTLSDLALGAVYMPLDILAGELKHLAEGLGICTALLMASNLLVSNSLLGLTLNNIERFIAIRAPYYYLSHVTRRKLFVAWVTVSATICVMKNVTVFSADVIKYVDNFQTCVAIGVRENRNIPNLRYLPVLAFTLVCFLILFYTSVQISCIARRHKQAMLAQDRISGRGIHRKDARTLSAFQSVGYLTATFFVTGIPRFVLILISEQWLPYRLPVVLVWLVYSNSVLNVLVYGFKLAEFREGLKKLVGWRRRGARVSPGSGINNNISTIV